jgi:hypothetical protein
MMAFVTDVLANIVQQRGILEPLPLAIRQAVQMPRLIEQRHRQPRNLLGMLRPVVATLSELDHAAPPDVRVALDLFDVRRVLPDVIQDEAFAKCEIAERQFLRAQAAQDRVDEDDAGDRQVGAARVETWQPQPSVQIHARQPFAESVDGLGVHAQIAHVS